MFLKDFVQRCFTNNFLHKQFWMVLLPIENRLFIPDFLKQDWISRNHPSFFTFCRNISRLWKRYNDTGQSQRPITIWKFSSREQKRIVCSHYNDPIGGASRSADFPPEFFDATPTIKTYSVTESILIWNLSSSKLATASQRRGITLHMFRLG